MEMVNWQMDLSYISGALSVKANTCPVAGFKRILPQGITSWQCHTFWADDTPSSW
jgi:hypothetical protein